MGSLRDKYELVVGLEVHAQLSTKTKAYCNDSTEYGASPNTQTSPITLGHPGTLPKSNSKVIEYAVKMGIACGSNIRERNEYSRKNYFYPDLPKGYQITQDTTPICNGGVINVKDANGDTKAINITRIHMEEDAGKSIHDLDPFNSLVDLNRAGVALIEIVSEPDIRSSEEAVKYLKKIHQIITYLDISDGDMSQGSMRCDANVSIMRPDDKEFGIRAEIKNINSFRFVEKAINFEIKRQIKVLESGEKVEQETRLYDSVKDETRSMRTKEFANDYRYFPCPDLVPHEISEDLVKEVKDNLSELPEEKQKRLMEIHSLNEYDAGVLCADKSTADFFEEVAIEADAELAAKWIIGDLNALLNKNDISLNESKVDAVNFSKLIQNISNNTISG